MVCTRRPRRVLAPRLRGRFRPGARRHGTQRLRQDLAVAADRGPADPGRRINRSGGRRDRAHIARTSPLSRPSRCAETCAQRCRKPGVLARFHRRRGRRHEQKPGRGGARSCGSLAGGLFVGRAAAAAVAGAAIGGQAADLAPRRAGRRTRYRRAKPVCRPDGRPSRERWSDHRRDPWAARRRGKRIADRGRVVTVLAALIRRDIRIAVRVGGGALIGVLFFLTVVVLMPFAVGPDLALLTRLGPAILWLGALLASLLTLDRLFMADHEDGSLDLIVMSRTPLELACATKALAHWMAAGLPLIVATPVLGLLLNLDAAATSAVALTLLAGTPALTFTGMIGAALAVTLHRGGLLLAVLVLPLSIPVLIFGVAASQAAISGLSFGAPFSILCALSLVSFVVGPFAAAASLRHGLD